MLDTPSFDVFRIENITMMLIIATIIKTILTSEDDLTSSMNDSSLVSSLRLKLEFG